MRKGREQDEHVRLKKLRKKRQRGFDAMYIRPSRISGRIDAPGSKSMMQRAVIAAALAKGESVLRNPSFCDDALATMRVVESLGAKVKKGMDEVTISGGGGAGAGVLDCGESGTCMRMITAVAALHGKEFTITGAGTLLSRPVGMVEGPLRALGAECETNGGKPPIRVRGLLHGGTAVVDGSESSQFVSGLLMALPLCGKESMLMVRRLKSKGYVRMTQHLLSEFGIHISSDASLASFLIPGNQSYRAREYLIEGDWSGAAFMLVAGAIAGQIEVSNLRAGFQPDRFIMDVLMSAGAKVEQLPEGVRVQTARLRAFDFDATGSPDLFPPLVALACACEGQSTIHGTNRLANKETDRAATLMDGFRGLGADISVAGNKMRIIGGKLNGGSLNPHGDHRIAMAGAVAALVSENGVSISHGGCVAKSYPRFFTDLDGLMVRD
jgi:3-phosphoshikimate 1-carboxyvinyltransferase